MNRSRVSGQVPVVRLNKAYRAIYSIQEDGVVEFARVDAVNKHEY
jgi:plasmid maintenance system antidote protein VapI